MNRSQRARRFIVIAGVLLLFEMISGTIFGNAILALTFLSLVLVLCGFRWREIKMEDLTDHIVGEIK